MNQEIKAEWLRRLRSGEYVQGQQRLRRRYDGVVKHCCLGVLCDMAVERGVLTMRQGAQDARTTIYVSPDGTEAIGMLPRAVQDWAGLPRAPIVDGETLPIMNDVLGFDFERIADLIEEKL